MVKIWKILEYDRSIADSLRCSLNLSHAVCSILVQRGIFTQVDAERFLWPKLAHLSDPSKIKNVAVAVARVVHAIESNETIAIVGDYDVDGITSITLMINILRNFGIHPKFYVPRRFSEGYGLSQEITERLLGDGIPNLVLAFDCGTNAIAEIELLRAKGCEVIVVDHHKSKEECVDCCIINPHIYDTDDDSAQKIFCTVGLVFKLCCGVLQFFRQKNDQRAFDFKIRDELDLVALGTIADLVPLVCENRIFCKYGLNKLASSDRRAGIEALCRVSSIGDGIPIYSADVAFKLSPRLNACGRLSDAVLPVKMLLSNDYDEALTYAYELDETNRERQAIEKEVGAEAESIVKNLYINDDAIVLFNDAWHSGVVGIISGQLSRDYQRPCIVLGSERGLAKGSGRSVSKIDLVAVLSECSYLLESWGGHPLAVGVSIKPENINAFRERFCEVVSSKMNSQSHDADEVISIAEEVSLDDIDNYFIHDLELLHPFGQSNPEPIFFISSVKITDMPERFGAARSNIKFWLSRQYSKRILVIGWDMADNIPPIKVPIDLAVRINMDFWNGNKSIRLTLVDWRISK